MEETHNKESIYLEQTNNIPDEPVEPKIIQTPLDPIELRFQNYLENNKLHLHILTPCFDNKCDADFVRSLIDTMDLFKRYNIEPRIHFCGCDSLITRARNNLVAKAMNDPNTTHILFIDSDITWDPFDVVKLIVSDKDLIGGIYPLKKYHWENIAKQTNDNKILANKWIEHKQTSMFKDTISDPDILQFKAVGYNLNYKDNKLNIKDNLAEVKHVATGFMMFKRNVIEKMQKGFPYTKYEDDIGFTLNKEESEQTYALFDCGVEDKHYLSEDWLFCQRWTNLGGSIFVDVTINLTHTGMNRFRGCFLSTIM